MADTGAPTVQNLSDDYDIWVHTGRLVSIDKCKPESEVARTQLHNKNVYPIRSYVRGSAVLISNTGYQALRLLKSAYEQLQFRIRVHLNKGSKEIRELLEEEATSEEQANADGIIVVVYGAPEEFRVEDMLEPLNDNNAPLLIGKPKMFFVIGNDNVVQQVKGVSDPLKWPEMFLGSTGFFGILFYIYILHRFGHERDAKWMWDMQHEFSVHHRFSSSTFCSWTKKFYFFPGLSVTDIPEEILKMDPHFIELYEKLLKTGNVPTHNVRLMFVGLFGVGKTSLARRFLGMSIDDVTSTDGIDVHIGRFEIPLDEDEEKWQLVDDSNRPKPYEELAKIMKFDPEASEMLPDPKNIQARATEATAEPETKSSETKANKDQIYSRTAPEILTEVKADKVIANGSDKKGNIPDTSEYDGEGLEAVAPDFKKAREERLSNEQGNYERLVLRPGMKTAAKVMGSAQQQQKPQTKASVSLWDFAGQFVYYATHQLFFSPRAIYLLMLKMDKSLDSILNEKWYTDFLGAKQMEMHGGIVFWTKSIYTYAKGTSPGIPPLVLVGTFKDQIDGNEAEKRNHADGIFGKIFEAFAGSSIECHLNSKTFLVDNTDPEGSEVDRLKSHLLKLAKEMPHWGQSIPAKWFNLEQTLDDIRAEEKPIISMEDFRHIVVNLPAPIESEDELILFLKYHHEIGTLIFFDDGELKNWIILKPQWIIDAFKSLISAEQFASKYGPLRAQWTDFQERGQLKPDLVTEIWKQSKRKDFQENEDKLLQYMEKLDIIVQGKILGADHDNEQPLPYYFVPCYFKDPARESLRHRPVAKDCYSTPILCFEIKGGFLPPFLFTRLLAVCISKWPVARQGSMQLLFCGFGIFEIAHGKSMDRHRLQLFSKGDQIGARIIRFSRTADKADPHLCDRVRRTIAEVIKKELGRYKNLNSAGYDPNDLPFKYTIQCIEADPTDFLEEGLIPVDDLIKVSKEPSRGYSCEAHSDRDYPHDLDPGELLMEWFPGEVPVRAGIKTAEAVLRESLPEEVIACRLNDKEIGFLSSAFGKNWQHLGLSLGIQQVVIDRCTEDHPHHTRMQIHDVLKKWKGDSDRQPDSPCKLEKLLEAIQKSKVTYDVDAIKNVADEVGERLRKG